MRLAIDIDSTLHHYWDLLSAAARRRFGVDLPYDEQHTWSISRLKQHQVAAAVRETHEDAKILGAEPYPGAVDVVRRWHEAGHWIHITSHRDTGAHDATAQWLERIGLPYDDLHCSYDKVTRCVELGIDVLVDDSPENLTRARERGITGATIRHPWNAELCAQEGFICADDWRGLGEALEPRLRAEVGAKGIAPVHLQEDPL